MKYVRLKNPRNGAVKTIKWGVSWVYLFFGGWALLFSGRWIFIILEIVLNIAVAAAGIGIPATGIYHLLLFLIGNKSYARWLKSRGWEPVSEEDARIIG